MTLKKIILIISFFFLPIAAFASNDATYYVSFLSSNMESIIEISSLLLALLASSYAIKLAALAHGGQMERTWNMLALASIIFALIEATNNSLKGFEIDAPKAVKLLELLLALVLVMVFMFTRKMLLKQVAGK